MKNYVFGILMITTQLSWGTTECRDVNTKLTINHSPEAFEAFATLNHQGAKYEAAGSYTISRDFLYKIYSYSMLDEAHNLIDIQISEQKVLGRGGCGRGGCTNSTSESWASISINGTHKIIIPCL